MSDLMSGPSDSEKDGDSSTVRKGCARQMKHHFESICNTSSDCKSKEKPVRTQKKGEKRGKFMHKQNN